MRSLRARLTIGVSVVLAVVLAGSLIIAEHGVRDSERSALDDRLLRYSQLSRDDALAVVQDELPRPNRRVDAALKATGTSLRLWVGDRLLIGFGAKPPSGRARRLGLQTFESGGERFRSDVIEIRAAGLGGLARQEVTAPLEPLTDRQTARLRRLLGVGIAALLIAALGTWLAASALLRPLRRLRQVTASIAADEDLNRTVPPDGPAEVRAVARSFNAMLARLSRSAADRERALEATRRFAADAGHELRSPLTSVQATLSTLARHPDLDAERRTAMAQDALAQQRRLVDLLDGLQALARGDARVGGPGFGEEIDLADLVATVAAEVGARHPGTQLDVRVPDGSVPMRGWDTGLRIVVKNLVENAARHGGSPTAPPHVSVHLDGGSGPGEIRLVVDDDGPGVPEADRTRIFEPFSRLDGAAPTGSGLGLALVAQQARLHGAQVSVADSPLGGARFTVTFPAPA